MSIRNVQANGTVGRTLKVPANSTKSIWVRNPTWLPMPSITSSDEEVDLLVCVYPESPVISVKATTSTGTYHVDWGDGTTSDTASTVKSDHLYTYSDTDLDGTDGPVTFTDTGDTVDRTAHGYTNGMPISFNTVVTTTGIVAYQRYYVINATADTFQLSATQGGSALALTTNGTGTILPFKQAIVKITCNTGGATMTSLTLNDIYTATNMSAYVQPILDVTISANTTTLGLAASNASLKQMERCVVLRHNVTDMTSAFSGCSSLQSVSISSTASVTNMSTMFNGCYMLAIAPAMNTSSVTAMTSMFSACYSLVTVPLYNTASVTNMTSMFSTCSSLVTVPLFNTAAVTSMQSMFYGCSSLVSVPLFNTAAVTTMLSMFSGCSSLVTVPLFNTSAVTNMTSMFFSCASLITVPLFNTSAVTFMTSMFQGCKSLETIPLFNTPVVNSMNAMFSGCTSLTSVPLLNTVLNTNFVNMFLNCQRLQNVPLFDTSAVTGAVAFATMFNGCTSLQSVPAMNFGRAATTTSGAYTNMFLSCVSLSNILVNPGPKFTFTVANLKLNGAALNALYTNLPTVTSQTITVTGNWGTSSDTPTIATAKGWTVTGS